MIEIKYIGEFGNNIFQYCIAKIIAENNKFAIKGFENKYKDILIDCNGINYSEYPIDDLGGHKHLINLQSAFLNTPRKIFIHGYYQIYDYYKNYKKQILQWLNLPKLKIIPEKNSITLHVRSRDVWALIPNIYHIPCPFSYYDTILKNENYSKIYLVTENENDIIVNKIKKKWDCQIISGSLYDDFNFIKNSRKIIMSVSTYSWWSAWLSDSEKIYFPEFGLFHPEIEKNAKLSIDNEDRYINVRLEKFLWNRTSEQINYITSD